MNFPPALPTTTTIVPTRAPPALYCWCRGLGHMEMTCCDGCDMWFHWNCIQQEMGGEAMEMAMVVGAQKWYCKECNAK